jgi:hypothetical protein
LEESGGIQFLVLELVEGETLANPLKRGPITIEHARERTRISSFSYELVTA